MAPLTLVPDALAAGGYRFTFAGPSGGEECRGCPLQKLCFGLQPGRTYQVTAVRPASHPCGLHDGGRVRAVEVSEVPFTATLERRHLRGTAAPWTAPDCGRPQCPSYALCHPTGHASGARHAVVRQLGPVECPEGFDLEKVEMKLMG